MAEARQAVGFSLTVTHDGKLDLDYDHEVVRLIFHSAIRSYKKRAARMLNVCHNGVFPFAPQFLAGSVVILTALHMAGIDHFTLGVMRDLNV